MFFNTLDDVRNSNVLTNEVKTYYETIVKDPKEVLTLGFNVEESCKEYIPESPLMKYIIENPFGESLPIEMIYDYGGDRTKFGTTPMMVAILVDNINYVRQLLPFNILLLDVFYTSALEYAYMSNSTNDIIKLLEEYEFCDNFSLKDLRKSC